MIRARLTLSGLYNLDNSIFDTLVLPRCNIHEEDLSEMFAKGEYPTAGGDMALKEEFIDYVLLQCGDFEVIHPNPSIFKKFVNAWSSSHYWSWQKLYNASMFVYDPIVNYDRNETSTITETRDLSSVTDNDGTTTGNGSTKNSGKITTTEYRSGFNSNSPVISDKEETAPEDETTTTNSATTKNKVTTGDTGTVITENTVKVKGNIGVTTSQKMIQEERELSMFHLVDHIVDDFKSNFCILVY